MAERKTESVKMYRETANYSPSKLIFFKNAAQTLNIPIHIEIYGNAGVSYSETHTLTYGGYGQKEVIETFTVPNGLVRATIFIEGSPLVVFRKAQEIEEKYNQ